MKKSDTVYSLLSDSELAEKIQHSNKDAFKELYFRYFKFLFDFCWHRLQARELSEDIVQEVFFRLWDKRKRINNQKSIKNYLLTITNNQIIDFYRKKSNNEIKLSSLKFHKNIISPDSNETYAELAEAVENLPEKLRTTFVLSRFHGFKYVEIAEIVGISVRSVEERISKAMKILRKTLK